VHGAHGRTSHTPHIGNRQILEDLAETREEVVQKQLYLR
jgi:hypothetical protein